MNMNNWTYKHFVTLFLAIILVTVGGYFIWSNFFKYDILKVYQNAEKNYVEAMQADTYGGKTPQETLDLFVAALKSGDVELASKYFLINENASREEWVKYLSSVKERGLLAKMANDIERDAKPLTNSDENKFAFGLFNKDGIIAIEIVMRLNTYTEVWKIEGLF